MNFVLSVETQALIEEKLRDGEYQSADELILAALMALGDGHSNLLDDQTLDAIDRAEDQIERGQVHDWSEVREQVRIKLLGRGSKCEANRQA